MESFDKSEQFDGFSKVVIIVSDEIEYSSGDDTGRTLTLNCPWGTQEIADNILQSIKGFQYQPMTANGALVDPSAEIGDGISANGVYSGIYSLGIKFNSNFPSDISAPADEEIDEEFPYKSSLERTVERQNKEVRASLSIQADRITQEVRERQAQAEEFRATFEVQSQQISAKVSQTGGSGQSFAWELLADHSSYISNGTEVFRVDSSGAQVNGVIRATGGKIGGFDIQSNYLSYNNQTWGGTNTTGIYAGPNGIQCGSASNGVQITSNGNLYAENGYFRGSVNAGNIQYGDSAGYLSGSGLASHSVYGSQIGYNTISTAYTSGGINTSLGYADFSNGVFNGWNTASSIYANSVTAKSSLYIPYSGGTRKVSVKTVTINGYVYNILTI